MAATVILGASNVSRATGVLVQHARAAVGGPQQILVAGGRGRSYGIRSHMLGRSLCGIVESELWERLDEVEGPVRALVTDVGNDVMFGVSTQALLGWVETCLERLGARDAITVVTALPLERLLAMSPRTFGFWKRVFFPARRLDFERARRQIQDVDDGLRELARVHGARLAVPDAAWYGVDPIHVRHHHVRAAWEAMLTPWGRAADLSPLGVVHRARLSFAPARGSRLWGRERRGAVRRYPDGAELGFY